MQMAVDETRGRNSRTTIDFLPGGVTRINVSRLTDRNDLAAINRDCRVANDATARVHGDQPGNVGDDEVDGLHGCSSFVSRGLDGAPLRGAPSRGFGSASTGAP